MTDTPTKVADVIVPDIFNPYYREQSTKLNAFFAAGLVSTVPDLTFGQRGGTQIDMPFWKALSERAQLLDDSDDLEIKAIETGKDIAVQHARGLVYGGTDLAAALAGSDPMMAIADGVAENWSGEFNLMLIATLKGAMGALGAESPETNTLDISALSGASAYIDGDSFIDAGQTLGDAKGKVSAIAMHSAVEAWLAKNDLIEYVQESDQADRVPFFMQKRVIVDDDFSPASGGIYESFLFGQGAVGFGEGSPKVPTETDRSSLVGGGQEWLVTRRHFVLHPRGVKWSPVSGVPAKQTPSDAELADPDNWERVWEPKNIRVVRIVHKIGA